jgi:hypothetical protein
LADVPVSKNDDVLMYAVGPTYRKKTEAVGKLAIGVKEDVFNNVDYSNIGYIMFHYWNNEKATPYKLLCTPRLVSKQNIPSGYLLRMGNGAEEFLLLEYDPSKPADIENYDIKNVMRKGKGRYMPFVTSFKNIIQDG